MNPRSLVFFTLTLLATFFCTRAKAQLPTCGIVYGVANTAIYNYDPTKPVSSSNPSINTIPVSNTALSGALGLTVSPILGSSSSTLTFYSITLNSSSAYCYAYYDPATASWVNTGHTVGGLAVNFAAGGGYIFSLEGGSGKVFRYDGTGNAILLLTVPGFRGASPYDLVADCDGNWYILNYNGAGSTTPFLRKYSPAGVLLQSWTINNQGLSASPGAGFGINGNILYTDSRGVGGSSAGIAFYTLGSTTLQLDSLKGFPGVNPWIDIGTCAASVPSTPMVTIRDTGNNGCPGDTVTLWAASVISGGTAPIFQWKVNGVNFGLNQDTFRYVPANGDVVTCVMTSNSVCANPKIVTSNPDTLIVAATRVTPAITISASGNNLCVGVPVNFTATSSNGGPAPVFQWTVNGVNVGTAGTTYTYTPALGDTVRCSLLSSISCVTSKSAVSSPVVMNVIAITPAVSISSSASTICSGSSVTVSAAPVNGGSAPTYQWKLNGSNVGTNSANYSFVPANGDVVTCVLMSNASCLTTLSVNSNVLTLPVITTVTPSLNIAASDSSVCTGTTVVFTASPTNGGLAPWYQWSVNGRQVSSGKSSYSYTPLDGDTVTCILSSSANCASPLTSGSNKIIMSVGPQIIPGINVNTHPPIVGCEGTPILFVTNIVAGGSAPTYQWYRNGVALPGATSPTYTDATLKNGDTIRATLISSVPCPSTPITWSNRVGLNLSLPVTPTIAISPSGPVPAGVPQYFTAAISGGGAAPKYQWMRNGLNIPFAIGPTYSSTGLSAGEVISAMLLSDDLCATQTYVYSNDVHVSGSTGVGSSNDVWITSLYPNPNTGTFTLLIHERNNAGGRRYTIDVINSVGQSLFHSEAGSQSAEFKQLIALPGGIPAGSYFLRVRTENGAAATIPFLIVR